MIVDQSTAATIIGATQKTLLQWTRTEGAPGKKVGHEWEIPIAELVAWHVAREVRKACPNNPPEDGELDLAHEQARLSRARADDQERKNKEAEGQLIPLDDVIAVGVKVLGIAKSGMNALGARCATKATSDKAMQRQLKAAIDKEVHSLLTQLSEHFGAISLD